MELSRPFNAGWATWTRIDSAIYTHIKVSTRTNKYRDGTYNRIQVQGNRVNA